MSHDVRTPLASVLGYAASLESDSLLPENKREQAALIRANGERLRELIDNLNLTNRLEHSMEPIQAHWFSPCAVVREAAAAFLNDDSNAECAINVDTSPAAAMYQLRGDRGLFLRMINNLIGNSLRHSGSGCTVTVSMQISHRALTLSVSDDGSGYSQEQLKFLAGKKQAVTSGHGLGLTIVRQIALSHGGKICFSNSPSGGAVCCIVFRHHIKKLKTVCDTLSEDSGDIV